MTGVNAATQHLAEQLNHLKSHTAKSEREDICPQENHCAHLGDRERAANPATMAADKVELQFAQRFRFNFDIGKFAESGADSVDDIAALENFFDDVTRFVNSTRVLRLSARSVRCQARLRSIARAKSGVQQFPQRDLSCLRRK
jgi:hypothetical protein